MKIEGAVIEYRVQCVFRALNPDCRVTEQRIEFVARCASQHTDLCIVRGNKSSPRQTEKAEEQKGAEVILYRFHSLHGIKTGRVPVRRSRHCSGSWIL